MSVGNVTQSINFEQNALTLVLGENMDVGDSGSRNGSGKTTIINALSYALYGCALTNIKMDNLVNKTNVKHMLVSVEFTVDNDLYRIERGRKPNVLMLIKNSETTESQGDIRETQKTIEQLLGMSHEIFKHTIALNTYTEPFLFMKVADQRAIIEELLGITLLSEKAEALKELQKATKSGIKEEEFKINAITQANEHIKSQIRNIKIKQQGWKQQHDSTIDSLSMQLERLAAIDINEETAAHQRLDDYNIIKRKIDEYQQWIAQIDRDNGTIERKLKRLEADLSQLNQNLCHVCGHILEEEKQAALEQEKREQIQECRNQLITNQTQYEMHMEELDKLGSLPEKPVTIYRTLTEVYEHKNKIDQLVVKLEMLLEESDPYVDQIVGLEAKGIQKINYDTINELKRMQSHQEFLLNLLTNKSSVIRKTIIDQNLSYLNSRLTHYASEIGLPHDVKFLSDLSVEISELGRDLDFGNLSRGERNRLILGLSWAFRDVWEAFYNQINVLFVDELVDNGLDIAGVDNAVAILNQMVQNKNKSVWVISHREELEAQVGRTMKVIKESGFTIYETAT